MNEQDEVIHQKVQKNVAKVQENSIEKLPVRGKTYQVGDVARYKLNDDVQSRQGGTIAQRYSKECEATEVLGEGFTYRLQAINRGGRVKDGHFNKLKTVERIG